MGHPAAHRTFSFARWLRRRFPENRTDAGERRYIHVVKHAERPHPARAIRKGRQDRDGSGRLERLPRTKGIFSKVACRTMQPTHTVVGLSVRRATYVDLG